MDKQNIQSYVEIANSYFHAFEDAAPLGQHASKKIFLKALDDYYKGNIELIVIAFIASDLYWVKNNTHDIHYYWDSYFCMALSSCEDGEYFLLEMESPNDQIKNMEEYILKFWNHEMMN
jgi:hypothetical protein